MKMRNDMSYSKSVYFIPAWFDDFENFTEKLSKEKLLWERVDSQQYSPRYLLNYAVRIAQNESLFQLFNLVNTSSLNIYMYEEELDLKNIPQIEQVRMACFSTGVGFLEFWINYDGMTPEEISDFAYLFKKATKMCGKNTENNTCALYDVAKSILPENLNANLFFTSTAPFKYECSCFHFIHIDESPEDNKQNQDRLYRLSRSYNTNFSFSFESDYDMVYKSSESDQWGGSSEGLVNITYDSKNDESDYYLHHLKLSHLCIDYYFLYLLLLNQRFASIQYINDIACVFGKSQAAITHLNSRIVKLKTVFSFNVISDDKVFQNVYSRMYSILEIEHLLADIVDNEEQMQIVQNARSAKTEQLSNKFLFGISILSLFSALIDASNYFDRINALRPLATILGFLCVCATITLCVVWLIKSQK